MKLNLQIDYLLSNEHIRIHFFLYDTLYNTYFLVKDTRPLVLGVQDR